MNLAYLALGSNQGDRLEQMRRALDLLANDERLTVEASSPIYQNRAIGMGDAADFLNAVVRIETSLEPEALLNRCLFVENKLGRVRTGVWGPRTIDLDVLIYESVVLSTERLQLPHPRILERDFVAKPLFDLDSELFVLGRSIRSVLNEMPSIDLEPYSESLL
ncbi:2-amino-4-hydroxy-6-hydroxymethyldihydropteridine diphosphokinase [Coraliomargarita akajimensis]|uniref:2-amino-4-hydroxy-6-hydroxymethyldihydropteridine pyrophosphokinase n=1 Tax=Coraliomargarita akajimensis (strain DSM 45221 / IAM 15411 / JCM 23193 / KCTC 12865 / 04OKA010-24) TaxID=583355 RepID=D5END7_CORAD|nr:2-amino-4-hydroxy-6-hydroxymethyldihydropteridine diphosphokinase [Coraliomargarita akajimensis]ADE55413.1 2-amino-4-hydroxy-6-hydroxymethyldihydropteridine pyrophosphokinase [Coraliomargarita akajimensis DSM 45221]